MESKTSMSVVSFPRAFYLPATAVQSAVPGRVERFVTGHLRDHSDLVRADVDDEPVRAFYLPGADGLATVSARVERFLTSHRFAPGTLNRAAVSQQVREFYLPATQRP